MTEYESALAFIHSIPWMGKKLGIEQISELLRMMGDPEHRLRYIHVAGTNGKGSSCEMLARILESAGYRVGFFVSPYIHRFNERMQINHRPIPDDELVRLTAYVRAFAERMAVMPSEFEVVTAMAFQYFHEQKCDYVVLEVGMGGRLDATNVIRTPLAAVIATIGLDHTQHLGGTIAKIAFEKAGIIKESGDAVVYGQGGEAAEVFTRIAGERHARITFSDFEEIVPEGEADGVQRFRYRGNGPYEIALLGDHQLKNAATVLDTVHLLRRKGVLIPEEAVRDGLRRAAWPGRFELLSKDPPFLADGGHNPEGARAAVDAFQKRYPGKEAVVLIGMTAGKSVEEVTDILDEIAAAYVVVQADNPRALPKEQLAQAVGRYQKPVRTAPDVTAGVREVLSGLKAHQVGFSVGSLYTLSEVRGYFGKN